MDNPQSNNPSPSESQAVLPLDALLAGGAPHAEPPLPESPQPVIIQPYYPYDLPRREFTPFVKGWLVTDLVFCLLRLLAVFYVLLMTRAMTEDQQIFRVFGVTLGIGVFCFGVLGNSHLLARKASGLVFAKMNILLSVLTVCLGICDGVYMLQHPIPGDPFFQSGYLLGAFLGTAVRLVFLVFYIKAVSRARAELPALLAAAQTPEATAGY